MAPNKARPDPASPKTPQPRTPQTPAGRKRLGQVSAGVLIALIVASGGYMLVRSQMPSPAAAGLGVPIGGPFSLVTGAGKPVTDRDFRGRYMLVYFGYTFCPDVCPTTLNEVAGAMDALGPKADKLQPVFITVDPRRDTPAVIKQYVAAFTPRLVGLTGTADQIAAAAKEYRVYYQPHKTGPGPDDYTMDHSSILYLMGPDGSFIAPIRADQPAPAMAAEISRYLG